MTTSQKILWTALPNGVASDGRLKLSALVSPRLRSNAAGAQLGPDFVDFLDWPKVINAVTFNAEVGGGQPIPVERVSAPADSTLWKTLFRATTSVAPFEFRDMSTRNIRSFPVAAVLGYVDHLYGDIAQKSPANLPPINADGANGNGGTLVGLLHDLGGITGHFRLPHGPRARQRLADDPDALDRLLGTDEWHKHGAAKDDALAKVNAFAEHRRFHALDEAFAAGKVVPPGASPSSFGFASPAAMDFYQAHRFYDRPEMLQPYLKAPDSAQVPPKLSPPTFDFHRILSALADYPVLLRMLGLVVDLTLDPAKVPLGTGTVRLVPSDFNTDPTPPLTRYERTKTRFGALPKAGSDLADGMLRLEGTNDRFDPAGVGRPFHLTQLDADGAALKLVNMASELWAVHNPNALMGASFDTPDTTGLPTLQSAGMALLRSDRAARLAARLDEESVRGLNANPGAVEHFADNVLRGYRVDVHDGKAWRSLCRREGTYVIRQKAGPDLPVPPDGTRIIDEGYVKSASATSADAKESDLYLHETVLRWDGWSVVAKRPGRTIVPQESADRLHQDEKVAWHESDQSKDVPLNTSFVPEAGTLPRLRFAQSYRFRARAVDLAGNSLGFDVADEKHHVRARTLLSFRTGPPAGDRAACPVHRRGVGGAAGHPQQLRPDHPRVLPGGRRPARPRPRTLRPNQRPPCRPTENVTADGGDPRALRRGLRQGRRRRCPGDGLQPGGAGSSHVGVGTRLEGDRGQAAPRQRLRCSQARPPPAPISSTPTQSSRCRICRTRWPRGPPSVGCPVSPRLASWTSRPGRTSSRS